MQDSDYRRRVHFELIRKGFVRVPSTKDDIYRQEIEIKGVIFPIGVVITDPYFVTKPLVMLLRKPENLPGKLPHLFFNFVLCYLDDTGVEFDQYSPEDNIDIVYAALINLLGIYASKPHVLQEDMRRELPVYWEAKNGVKAFLISSKPKELFFQAYTVSKGPSEIEFEEIAIGESDNDIDYWIKRRNGTKLSQDLSPASIIELSNKITFPDKGWPPESLEDVIVWLKQNGEPQKSQDLVRKTFIALAQYKTRSCLIILKLGEIHFSIKIQFKKQSSLRDLVRRYQAQTGNSRKYNKRRQATKTISISGNVMESQLIKAERNDNGSVTERITTIDSSSEVIANRNLSNKKSLRNLKIALIGCGTIGGYAGQMLMQAGAGAGNGSLHLFDSGILEAENLGRHFLGVEYLDEYKSYGLQQQLLKLSGHPVNIQYHSRNMLASEAGSFYGNFDIAIDATGEIGFSASLCHQMHRAEKKVPIIYTWVDAGGLAVRALIDEVAPGKGCYNCLKDRRVDGRIVERFQLFRKDAVIPEWRPRACGTGGYMPFNSHASVAAAGLAQSLCLGWINSNPSPRFRHISLDKRVCEIKNQDITSIDKCPCCQIS